VQPFISIIGQENLAKADQISAEEMVKRAAGGKGAMLY